MRKLYLVLILILAFTITSSASNFQNKGAYTVDYSKGNKSELALKFSVSKYTIQIVEKDGVKYSVIDFNHGVNTNLKGYAELPMLNATLQLESDNDVILSVVEGDFIDIQLDYPLLPSRGTIYRNQNPSSIPYIIDPASIVDKFYPENIAESAEPFVFRDTRGVNIYTYPFRYNAAKNILRVYADFSVIVKEDFSKSTNPLTIAPSNVDPAMNDIYKSLFINYNESKFANQIGQHGEMLVIYTSRDATVIQPYITWKRERGFIVHTLQVATGTNVKTNIQNAYNANPNLLYVQLVGDWADIKSNIGAGANAPLDPDLACVAGGDFYPELIIGRFSAESTAHVTTQINKAINYEKSPNTGSYYKNTLGIASNEGPGDDSEYDNQHMDVIIDHKLLTYNYTASDRIYNNGGSTAMQAQVSADLNGTGNISGVGVINYCGHGTKTTFYSSGFSNTNINALTNGNLLPFIWSVACVNGEFHTAGDCFAEAWLRKENGGAVATLMATINQPWIPPMRGQDYFNDILRGGYNYSTNPGSGTSTTAVDKRTTFGSISVNGCVLMLAEAYTATDTRNTIQTWTLFGDASLQVRTDTPANMTIGHLPNVMFGFDNFEVSCNTEGAFGALTKNGVLIGAAYCTGGIIDIPLSGINIGDVVKLVVTAYNKIPYIIDLEVAAPGPYANFSADKTSTLCQEVIVFTDASDGGTFSSWSWSFGAGATPATATGQGPHNVSYSTVGLKNVSLLVDGTYERVRNNYINVLNTSFLAVNIDPPAGGVVNTNPEGNKFLEGTYVSFNPVANANYEFSHFSGDLLVLDNCVESLPYTEPFSTNIFTTGKPCWENQNIVGANAWTVDTYTAYWKNTANNNSSRMIAPPANIRYYSNVTLEFDLQRSGARIQGTFFYPEVTVEYWNGSSWVALQTYSGGTDATTMNTKTVSLPAEAFTEDFKIGFRASATRLNNDIWVRVGDFSLTGTWGLGENDIWLFMDQTRTVTAHFTYLGGSVIVGDVNSDGFINVLDVVWMVSHLNGSTPVGFDMDAADVNEDGFVNISDLTALINLVLNTAK